MRTRAWRREMEVKKVIKRLKMDARMSWWHTDANDNRMDHFKWIDGIGTHNHFIYKTITTVYSKYKTKWGLHGKKQGKKGYAYSTPGNRIDDKRLFKRELEKEYQIKSFNISYGYI